VNENMRIWDSLSTTDPKHTKGFSRAGGFKGTALKPIWIIKRLTETFGPCGEGWGLAKPDFQVVQGDGEVLVYCTISGWYKTDDALSNGQVWGVGGDKVVAKRKDGSFNDDEAFKKAFTDAVNNAFKFIGVGADIHMGMFEDDKYVTEARASYAEPEVFPVEVEAMLAKIKTLDTVPLLMTWRKENGKAADATGFGPLIAGEWATRKAGLEQVAALTAG